MHTLLAMILPAPERLDHERRSLLDVPFWSMLLGWAQLAGAFVYLVNNYLFTLRSIGSVNAAVFAAAPNDFEHRLAYNWSGAFNAVLWLVQPTTLFGFLVAGTGLLRLVAFASGRESLGEPLVYLGLRIGQLFRRKKAEKSLAMSLGRERPDRFLPGENGHRFLLSARQRPDWQVGLSVDFGDELLQIVGVELKVPEGETGKVWFYELREQPANELIRRMVAYDPR